MFQTQMLNQVVQGLDPIHSKSINLRPGQVFQGAITQLYPGQLAQLQLGALTLTAKLEAQLEKGERYWFRVLGGEGLPRIKVLESVPNHRPNDGGNQLPLQQLGLDHTKANQQVIQRLSQENLPFTPQNIRDAGNLFEQSQYSNQQTLNLITMMVQRGLPLTNTTFESMAALNHTQSMAQMMESMVNGLKGQPQLSKVNDQLVQMLTSVLNSSGQMTNTNDSSNSIDHQIRSFPIQQLIQLLGVHHEADLKINMQNEQYSQQQQTMKALLLQFIKQPVHLQGGLREQAELLLNRITGNQLLSTDSYGPIHHIAVQIPVKWQEKYKDVMIQWEGKKKSSGQIDKDHCRILLYLELESLNETVVDVQIQNKIVSLQVFNEHEKPFSIQNLWFPFLKGKLHKLDYELTSLKWTNPVSENEVKKPPRSGKEYTSYKGVDVRI
ncbi:hypothetical protein LGQ02_12805 [Bacillus shivajii]|uniref:hypothetical protein n=1 Tax=Bacillus shivajii TaxID=1983719 RepID=UPI001CFB0B75|nr:hypothetical protein [Bacillus shivajii]UCZ51740.1 hypothetical protein LGQ02_12805 [Bacillus shivajii]